MAESVQIASLEGGELKVPASVGKRREVVLALPLNRLLVKMVRIPTENLEDPLGYVTPIVKAMSPFPDEPLTVSCETVSETEEGRVVVALAMPESSADDIAGALDGAGLNVTRIDALPFGLLPQLLAQVVQGAETARRVLLVGSVDCVSVFVLDGAEPCAIRAIARESDFTRELMLSLVEAEEFAGARALQEIVTVGDVPAAGLETFAPVRTLETAADPLDGLAARAVDPAAANALPESWHEVLEETRFKRKMKIGFGIAGGIWAAAFLVLIGGPRYFAYRTSLLEDERKEHRELYNEVNEKKAQVMTVKSISNRDRSALETLRVTVAAMPPGSMELTRWAFKRDERLMIEGILVNGGQKQSLQFKDNLSAWRLSEVNGNEDDDSVPFFAGVELPDGINNQSTKFSVNCSFRSLEETL